MPASPNRVENAVHAYKNERLNCAQAVLKAFADVVDLTAEDMRLHRAIGGGRAPEGICGALHATRSFLSQEHFEQLARRFEQRTGARRCREIRAANEVPCHQCVAIAAELVEETR